LAEPTSKRTRRRPPISRHPLFPAIVGLWFAALLTLGSFAISTSLLERLVLAGHIDAIIPAAAPPLGETARLMLALVLGVGGGATGWILARRLANPRAKAGPQVFKVAEADLEPMMPWPGTAESAAIVPALVPAHPDPAPDETPLAMVMPSLPAPSLSAPNMAPPLLIEHPAIETAPERPTAAQRIAAAELEDLSHIELVERLAIALQRRRELLGAMPEDDADAASAVIHFPDFADRRGARPAASRVVPQETEKALREALTQLQRLSGSA
jgi:hypothetical protein